MRTTGDRTTRAAIDAPAAAPALEWHENDLAVCFGGQQFGGSCLDGEAHEPAERGTGAETGVMGVTTFAVLAASAAIVSLGGLLLG